jgi:hypothetical protein
LLIGDCAPAGLVFVTVTNADAEDGSPAAEEKAAAADNGIGDFGDERITTDDAADNDNTPMTPFPATVDT